MHFAVVCAHRLEWPLWSNFRPPADDRYWADRADSGIRALNPSGYLLSRRRSAWYATSVDPRPKEMPSTKAMGKWGGPTDHQKKVIKRQRNASEPRIKVTTGSTIPRRRSSGRRTHCHASHSVQLKTSPVSVRRRPIMALRLSLLNSRSDPRLT